jgi:hypothetical protein
MPKSARNGQIKKPYKAVSPSRSHADSCNNAFAERIETKLYNNPAVIEEVFKFENDFRIRI